MKKFFAWIISLVTAAVTKVLLDRHDKPTQTQDASTPKDARDQWNRYVSERMREQDRDCGRHLH